MTHGAQSCVLSEVAKAVSNAMAHQRPITVTVLRRQPLPRTGALHTRATAPLFLNGFDPLAFCGLHYDDLCRGAHGSRKASELFNSGFIKYCKTVFSPTCNSASANMPGRMSATFCRALKAAVSTEIRTL